MALISYLSLRPFSEDGLPDFEIPHIDKLAHAIFYAGMVVSGSLFIRERTNGHMEIRSALSIIFLVAFGYGILIEVLQDVLPAQRTADLWDVFANTTGAVLGVWGVWWSFSRTDRLKWKH